jgi:hypothetical protein
LGSGGRISRAAGYGGIGRLYDVMKDARLAAGQGGQCFDLHRVLLSGAQRWYPVNVRKLSSDQIRGNQIRSADNRAFPSVELGLVLYVPITQYAAHYVTRIVTLQVGQLGPDKGGF